MSTTSVTKCDSCEKEITYTSYAAEYYLSLNNRAKPHLPNSAVYAMQIYPEIDRTKDFCGLTCLRNWIIKTVG